MFVKIPVFSGYYHMAICPGYGNSFYIMDSAEKSLDLYTDMIGVSSIHLPLYQHHHYIFYPASDEKVERILYFNNFEELRKHICGQLGTDHVSGRFLDLTALQVSKNYTEYTQHERKLKTENTSLLDEILDELLTSVISVSQENQISISQSEKICNEVLYQKPEKKQKKSSGDVFSVFCFL